MSSTTSALNDESRDTTLNANAPVYPPGPHSRFFGLGLHRASQRNPLGFMRQLAHDYGDIVYFKIGQQPIYLLNHPEHIKGVLSSHYANFLKGRGIVRRDSFLGEGMLTSEGNFHRQQRQLTKPAFDHGCFTGYAATMTKLAAECSESWRAGDTFDVLEAMRKITLPIASQTLFGTSVDADHERIIAAFRTLVNRFSSFRPLHTSSADQVPLINRRRQRRARAELETLVSRIIAERRHKEDGRGDLLSLLLSRTDVEDSRLSSDSQIRDEAITLFIGGFENVATTLTWTWYLLAQHPDIEKRLHKEVDSLLDGRLPTADDVPRLSYTRKVLEESMRIYPPVPRLVRTALRNYQLGAYTIPAGALVVVSQYLMHRDARYYPEPERFDPERWTPEAKAARPAYSFFPFGGGPRRCIGEGFAYMEGVLVLATLALQWKLSLTSNKPVELSATHFLHPKRTLTMKTERRVD